MPTPVACIGSREPIVLTIGTEACPAAGRGRAPRCRRAPRGARWRASRAYRSCRNGEASCAQPGLHRRQQPEVPQPPADDVLAGAGAGQRAPGDQLADQPVRGGQRAGRRARPARSGSAAGARSSNAPSSASARDGDAGAGREVLPAIRHPHAVFHCERKS